jgi:hypothetical protein
MIFPVWIFRNSSSDFRLIERCCTICEHSEYEDFEEYFYFEIGTWNTARAMNTTILKSTATTDELSPVAARSLI